MIELTEDNIYSVKNFAKHQNIKIKEKINSKDKEDEIDNKEVKVEENLENEIQDNEDKQSENKISQNKVENGTNDEIGNLKITHKDVSKIDDDMSGEKINNNLQNNIPILLETEKRKKANKKKKKEEKIDCIDEDVQDNRGVYFYDTDEGRPLAEGEIVTQEWSF